MTNAARLLAALGFASTLACGQPPADTSSLPERTPVSQMLDIANGNNLNGNNLNGNNLNGNNLNGPGLGNQLVSVDKAGAMVNGSAVLDSLWIDGSQLRGQKGASTWAGTDFVLANFYGTSDTGKSVYLRVANVQQEAAPDDDSWLYTMEFWDPVNSVWQGLCTDSTGVNRPTYAVEGIWNQQQGVAGGGAKIVDGQHFTFACKGLGAIGKCISPIGYRPWRTINGVSLDRYHQACVRLIRADFCGDGTSYTVNGQMVNLYDNVGVQQDTENWVWEANWDENGARCFNYLNRSHSAVPCYQARGACSTLAPDFSMGTLLIDETPCNIPGSATCVAP